MVWAYLRKKAKNNGSVGAKNRGLGLPTLGKERKRMISRGQKQGAGRANLRKKRKQMDNKGLKTGGRRANLRKKEKMND